MWPVAEPFYMVWFVKSQKSISWNTWHVWNKDTRVIWWHSVQPLHPMLVGSQVLSWILRIKKVEGGWEGVRGDEATVFKKPQLWRGKQLSLSKVLQELCQKEGIRTWVRWGRRALPARKLQKWVWKPSVFSTPFFPSLIYVLLFLFFSISFLSFFLFFCILASLHGMFPWPGIKPGPLAV